jgi:nucleoside-diphosphate-sugar epimerase
VLDRESVLRAVEGASNAVLSVAFTYDARIWRHAWPTTMANVLDACEAAGARLVFVDNLYQLGPQCGPRTEAMPLSAAGQKASILSEVTRMWMAAADRVRVAALRCTDFYGPGVIASHLGPSAFGAVARGKPALMLAPPDIPHDFAYVPDIARAVVTLLDAPDDAFGQVWNMPCAATRTPREILQIGADALGVALKVRAIPLGLLPALGLVSRFLKEVDDVRYTWDRPYEVDGNKFTQRFWADVTPYEIGAVATARSYVEQSLPR